VGGLTRSFHVDGFTFDITGHLLHLRRPEVLALVDRILPDGMGAVERRSFIYSHGAYTDYPFQANLHGLPAAVVRECLVGFIEAHAAAPGADPEALAAGSFHDWVLATFGAGIARHFMLPYNRKLWCRDLRQVTADWVSWSVPRPKVEEVVGGALGLTNRGLGYNPTFRYPRAGGIEVLPNALAAGLRHADLRLKTSVVAIDPTRRQVRTADGSVQPYEDLVSTLPLPRLLALLDGLPDKLRQAAAGLQATQVLNINLGIAREGLTQRHWIYFPEDRYVFYRVGSPTAFCPASAPSGCSSLYVEVARLGLRPDDIPGLVAQVKEDLVACDLLRPDDAIVAEQVVVVDPAYVIFDAHRRQVLPGLLDWLQTRRIRSIGRYGRWEYGSMEDAIYQGMQTAASAEKPHKSFKVVIAMVAPGFPHVC
jgi:protoporphyrinogen oxidase